MHLCKICGKLSATNKDHTGCIEKRRLELAEAGKAENAGSTTDGELASELGALIGHIASNRNDD